jgi:uncharacterized repeat protein (TIGR03837 family)
MAIPLNSFSADPSERDTLLEAILPSSALVWDVFCRVIDNFGDIGVCWRLCADLAKRGQEVRLWTDDSSALDWMAPGARQGLWHGIRVLDWRLSCDPATVANIQKADVWIEAFGCEIPEQFIALQAHTKVDSPFAIQRSTVWINLEYLSAEAYVERCHGLPSPIMVGPAKGWTKYFFYPGFSGGTGGLLREPEIRSGPEWTEQARQCWLERMGIQWDRERLVSLFCYEPAVLEDVLSMWIQAATKTLLLVTSGRAAHAVTHVMSKFRESTEPSTADATSGGFEYGALRVQFLQPMTQADYDALLQCCDLNFVRGEDSLIRAIWAGRPFVWQIYPQDDGAHAKKLSAFLDIMDATVDVRQIHASWNELPNESGAVFTPWTEASLNAWQDQVRAFRQRLFALPDLTSSLVRFVLKRR